MTPTKPFDPTKPCMTRDGRTARIICTNRLGKDTIVALVGTGEQAFFYDKEGRHSYYCSGRLDLVNVPERKTVYVNMYAGRRRGLDKPSCGGQCHVSVEQAVIKREDIARRMGKTKPCTLGITYEDDTIVDVEIIYED